MSRFKIEDPTSESLKDCNQKHLTAKRLLFCLVSDIKLLEYVNTLINEIHYYLIVFGFIWSVRLGLKIYFKTKNYFEVASLSLQVPDNEVNPLIWIRSAIFSIVGQQVINLILNSIWPIFTQIYCTSLTWGSIYCKLVKVQMLCILCNNWCLYCLISLTLDLGLVSLIHRVGWVSLPG